MQAIDDLLKMKGQPAYSITTDAPILDTIQLAAQKEVEALLYLEAGRLVVMVSQGDVNRKLILARKSLSETLLRGIISRIDLHPTSSEEVGEEAMDLSHEKPDRCLPIMIDGYLVGKISMGDLTRIVLADQGDKIVAQ